MSLTQKEINFTSFDKYSCYKRSGGGLTVKELKVMLTKLGYTGINNLKRKEMCDLIFCHKRNNVISGITEREKKSRSDLANVNNLFIPFKDSKRLRDKIKDANALLICTNDTQKDYLKKIKSEFKDITGFVTVDYVRGKKREVDFNGMFPDILKDYKLKYRFPF